MYGDPSRVRGREGDRRCRVGCGEGDLRLRCDWEVNGDPRTVVGMSGFRLNFDEMGENAGGTESRCHSTSSAVAFTDALSALNPLYDARRDVPCPRLHLE